MHLCPAHGGEIGWHDRVCMEDMSVFHGSLTKPRCEGKEESEKRNMAFHEQHCRLVVRCCLHCFKFLMKWTSCVARARRSPTAMHSGTCGDPPNAGRTELNVTIQIEQAHVRQAPWDSAPANSCFRDQLRHVHIDIFSHGVSGNSSFCRSTDGVSTLLSCA